MHTLRATLLDLKTLMVAFIQPAAIAECQNVRYLDYIKSTANHKDDGDII